MTEKKILYESKNKLIQEISILKNKIQNRKTNIEKLNKKLIIFNNIKNEYDIIKNKINIIEKLKLSNIKNIEQKKVFLKNFDVELKDINLKISEIKKAGPDADCPTCERILGDQYNKLLSKYILKNNKFQVF